MMRFRTFITGATPLALLGGLVAMPANAADEPLTAYEQSLACKFSQTCDPETLRTYEDDADSEQDGVIVGDEAPFNVFTSGKAQATPAANRSASAGNAGAGPRLYTGNRAAPRVAVSTVRTQGYRSGPVRSNRSPVRKNAADMSVFFGNASADVDAGSRAEIGAWANVLNSPAFASTAIRIEGHTNAVGGREYNLELSQRRAEAVKQLLISRGVSASRIEAVGFGFDKPRASNPRDTTNRRVEIVKTN